MKILLKGIIVQSSGAFGVGQRQRTAQLVCVTVVLSSTTEPPNTTTAMGLSVREHMSRPLETGRFCCDEILLKRILVQSSGAFGVGQRQRAGNELSHSVFIKGLFPS